MILSPESKSTVMNDLESEASKDRFWEVMRAIKKDTVSLIRLAAGRGEGSAIAKYRLASRFEGIAPSKNLLNIFLSKEQLHNYNVGLVDKGFTASGELSVIRSYRQSPDVDMKIDFSPEVGIDSHIDKLEVTQIALREGAEFNDELFGRLAERYGETKPGTMTVNRFLIKEAPPKGLLDAIFSAQDEPEELFMLSIYDTESANLLKNL